MRIITAKEYKMSQIPLVGEYSLYQYNNEYFFTVGDGSKDSLWLSIYNEELKK